ncbi:MAG: SusC/RagA family TonB-linked outer membrane protein [Tenuifilaceae bacterium]
MKRLLLFFYVFLIGFGMMSMQAQVQITGKVTDQSGDLPGISVLEKGTTNGAITDLNGFYKITVANTDAILIFSFVGYTTQEITVGSLTVINIKMETEELKIDELVVVGYGTQKKPTLTGAISSISNDEIVATKTQNVQNLMTGKVAGVRVVQKTSEPGSFTNLFDIRGMGAPLYVIDGVPRGDLARLDGMDIESISVLKDASASIYGMRAANGVVLVTTKKGKKGKPEMTYSGYWGTQIPAEILKPVGALNRMQLMNERDMRNNYLSPSLTFSDAQMEEYRNGTLKSTDWYDETIRNRAPQQTHNLSVSGGTDDISYYFNFGYSSQEGFFKSNSLNYEKANVRANIDAKIANGLKFSLKLSGISDETMRQNATTREIFKLLWRSLPSQTVYANNNQDYLQKPSGDIMNAIGATNIDMSGYNKQVNRIFTTSADLTYDVPFIEGLSAKAMVSYDPKFVDLYNFTKSYKEYNYDAITDTYSGIDKNAPGSFLRSNQLIQNKLFQGSLNYKKTFAFEHNFKALALLEFSHAESDQLYAKRFLNIPIDQLYVGNALLQEGSSNNDQIYEYISRAVVGRVNYDFAGKYLFEYSFRYDGSSRFPKDKQWGYFPNYQLGWRMSEELFIKDNLSFISNLKIRGTYGVLGDDAAANQYSFISGYDYPYNGGSTQQGQYPSGYFFNGVFYNVLGFRAPANMDVTWYTSETYDLGLDIDLWKDKLGLTVDIFKRDRKGLLANRNVAVPSTYGTNMPQVNINSDQTRGIDLEVRHKNKVSDITYSAVGTFSYTRTKRIHVEGSNKISKGNSWDNWKNGQGSRYNDIWFGLEGDGWYQSFDEISQSGLPTGTNILPGDYKYKDWNNDGVIDGNDDHPIAINGTNPLVFFGLNLAAEYKGFDLRMMFQGAAMAYVAYAEQLATPLSWDGNALDYLMNRWHPVDPTANPYDPNNQWVSGKYQYGAKAGDANSTHMIQDGKYVRLKTIEFGYSLPKKWLKMVKLTDLRVYISGYNLLTFTNVEALDPEHPGLDEGYTYPLNKTINFGVNLSF